MRGKKRLDLLRAGLPELGDGRPPLLATWNEQCQLGERLDAVSVKCADSPWWKPALDFVGDRRRRHCCGAKLLGGLDHTPCVLDSFGCPQPIESSEVVAMTGEGTAEELASNSADYATSGSTGCEQMGKILNESRGRFYASSKSDYQRLLVEARFGEQAHQQRGGAR